MDVQMLLASNYKALGEFDEAEKHLKLASSMCPSRFMPLYVLTELLIEIERMEDAFKLAQKIIDKEIKIPSVTVFAIKNKMQELIDGKSSINHLIEEKTDKPSSTVYETPKGRLPP